MDNRKEQSVNPREPRRWYIFACLTILALALTSNIESSVERAFLQEDDLIPGDFPVFYLGGKVALQRGATLLYYPPPDPSRGYTLLFQDPGDSTPWAQLLRANGFSRMLRFINPPFSALLMAPLALMPWQSAYILWQIITLILTAATIFLSLRLFTPRPSLEMFVVMFGAACFFFPLRNTVACGQVNVAILFLWTLGVYLFKQQRPMASALCFALGTVLKISPVVALPLLALRRQWRWLGTYVAGVGAFTGVSIWRLGWQTHLTWLTVIYPSISSGVGNIINRSLAGLVDALCGPRYSASLNTTFEWPVPYGLSLFEKACSLAIGLGFIYWCWRKRRDGKGLVDELIVLPLVYLLAAPFSWSDHFVLALLPLTYFWAKAREATTPELAALLLCTLALGTELPMYVAAYTSTGGPHLIILAIALWPAATCAMIWVGMRMSLRSQESDPQQALSQ